LKRNFEINYNNYIAVMASFVAELGEITNSANAEKEKKHNIRMEEVKDKLFVKLTDKYFMRLRNSMRTSAKRGFREKYFTFVKDDFKANTRGIGYPRDVLGMWLNEMCDPESSYLLTDEETGSKLHLNGASYEVIFTPRELSVNMTW
jgi:hypothetical protein